MTLATKIQRMTHPEVMKEFNLTHHESQTLKVQLRPGATDLAVRVLINAMKAYRR